MMSTIIYPNETKIHCGWLQQEIACLVLAFPVATSFILK